MRMTVKGQVTIPVEVRRKLGLRPGDDVAFVEEEGRVFVHKPAMDTPDHRAQRIRAWIERVKGTADGGLSADELLDVTRDREPTT